MPFAYSPAVDGGGDVSNTIWKFELELTDVQHVKMPAGARILSVDRQTFGSRAALMLWALVDPSVPAVNRKIGIVGTGNPAPSMDTVFVGTVVMPPFVWHVFDGGEAS